MVSDGKGDAGVFAALAYSKVRYWCGGTGVRLGVCYRCEEKAGGRLVR